MGDLNDKIAGLYAQFVVPRNKGLEESERHDEEVANAKAARRHAADAMHKGARRHARNASAKKPKYPPAARQALLRAKQAKQRAAAHQNLARRFKKTIQLLQQEANPRG